MFRAFAVFVIFAVSVLSGACGSGGGDVSGTTGNGRNSANNAVDNGSTTAQSGTTQPTSVSGEPAGPNQVAPGIPSDPSTASVSNADANVASAGTIMDQGKRKIIDVPPSAADKNMPKIPAPDNSFISVTMGKKGEFIESRVFNANPYFSKVVRTSLGSSKNTVIYLKNGRSVATKKGDEQTLSSLSLNQLMDATGIKPPAPKPDPNAASGTEQKPVH